MVTSRFSKLSVTILSLILGVAFLLPLFSIKVYASGNTIDKPKCTLSGSAGIEAVCNDINREAKQYSTAMKGWLKYNSGTCTLEINMSAYNKLEAQEKQDIMGYALSAIEGSDIARKDRIKMYNFVAEQDEPVSSLVRQLSQDVNADFATAYSWFKPFSGGISTVLGFLSLVIFAMLGLMMVLDLSYIAIPPFKAVLDKPSGEQPKGISKEAFTAVQEAEKDNKEYKSAMGIYFKLKVKQVVLLAICLLYLVGGKIYNLVAMLIDTLSGIVGD